MSLVVGFSDSFPVRLLQGIAVFGAGAVLLAGTVVFAMVRLAGWKDPESEEDFELLVQRAERLAAAGLSGESDDEMYGDEDDDYDHEPQPIISDEDFKALVRS